MSPYDKNEIKRIRTNMLLTQEEFAKRVGVSFETVNRWENGKHEPTMKAKRKIKRLLESQGTFEVKK